MVAKSFTNFTFLSSPFVKGGKEYVRVQNPKTGTIREVRWYPDPPKVLGTLKKCLGFEKGFIYVYKNPDKDLEYSKRSRFHTKFGWYTVSTEQPVEGYEYTKLEYNKVFEDENHLKGGLLDVLYD